MLPAIPVDVAFRAAIEMNDPPNVYRIRSDTFIRAVPLLPKLSRTHRVSDMDVPSILPLRDPIDQKLLRLLRADARLSVRGLSRAIGMSAGAVGERLERLEARGVIKGYRVDVDATAVGLEVEALIGVELGQDQPAPDTIEALRTMPEVVHVDLVTGRWDLIVRLVLRDHQHLKEVLGREIWTMPSMRRSEAMIVLDTFGEPVTSEPANAAHIASAG